MCSGREEVSRKGKTPKDSDACTLGLGHTVKNRMTVIVHTMESWSTKQTAVFLAEFMFQSFRGRLHRSVSFLFIRLGGILWQFSKEQVLRS